MGKAVIEVPATTLEWEVDEKAVINAIRGYLRTSFDLDPYTSKPSQMMKRLVEMVDEHVKREIEDSELSRMVRASIAEQRDIVVQRAVDGQVRRAIERAVERELSKLRKKERNEIAETARTHARNVLDMVIEESARYCNVNREEAK
jgi:hypothetical protein